MRRSSVPWGLLLATAIWPLVAARADSPFSVYEEQGTAIRLGRQTIAQANMPEGFAPPRLASQEGGCTARGEKNRLEVAVLPERLEYSVEFLLEPPVKPWRVLMLPLPEDAAATIVYGTFERPPQTTEIRAGDLTGSQRRAAETEIRMVRWITVRSATASFALDTQPAGAMGDDPADNAGVMRALVCRPLRGGLELRMDLSGSYPASVRAKFVFYAPPKPFSELHPFVQMNYRYAFEKVLKLDFTSAPMPKKIYQPRSVATQAYREDVGYGWTSRTQELEEHRSSLAAPLYGQYVGSRQPGRFRIDLPAGHYYLTLNVGNADQPVGPMRVLVNGQPRIDRLALAPGRFKAELLWITSEQDHLEIEFQGLDGAAWQVNGLTVSSLGTLGEDFTLTRPWWRLPMPGAPRAE